MGPHLTTSAGGFVAECLRRSIVSAWTMSAHETVWGKSSRLPADSSEPTVSRLTVDAPATSRTGQRAMPTAAFVLGCALDLLANARPLAPVVLVAERPPSASAHTAAFVREGDPTIYLVASSLPVRAAIRAAHAGPKRCGHSREIIMLASVLAHEDWHLQHPGDETGAYLKQLTTLQFLGLDLYSREANEVRRAMRAGLAAQNRSGSVAAALEAPR
jgi:hypothetical protein